MSIFANTPPIRYEGPETSSDLAYRVYDKTRLVLGRSMEDWLRFAVCYWHSFNWPGNDIFGAGTLLRPWIASTVTQPMAEQKTEAAFDFLSRLGATYFTFHDVDVMASASTLREHEASLRRIEEVIAAKMARTGVRLLWGTANLTADPRYAGGAATSPDPEVFAWAASQVCMALDATHRLGGENYVLWGGREGYDTLLHTNLRRELDQYGRFLSMVVDHKHKIGFKGALLIEPKPFEPVKHMYDRDVAAVYAFLQRYKLLGELRVNIEVNHATLAGLDFEHEVAAAIAYDIFGSIDINRGDPRNGWDTDQFPNNAQDLTPAMLHFLANGGFKSGGFNFDAKLRRQSADVDDLYLAHIAGIDTLARALLNAATVIQQGRLAKFREERYSGWSNELGRRIEAGEFDLAALAAHAMRLDLQPQVRSGRQELCESLIANAARH